MTQRIFKRYELKFLVNEAQFKEISDRLSTHMKLDEHCKANGTYMIYNLYYDTENDDIIRKSLAKPYYKEKLRLRCYTIPVSDNDRVFLELKKKINGVVNKRRATMTYHEAENLIKNGIQPVKQSYTDKQVLNEISDFLKRYKVKPKVFLSYERIAYYGIDDHNFRVTFDKKILTRREKTNFTDGDFGTELLDDDKYLMEVKINGALPLWFAEMLSEMKIYKTSFSKYGMEYKKYAKSYKPARINYQTEAVVTQILDPYFLTA